MRPTTPVKVMGRSIHFFTNERNSHAATIDPIHLPGIGRGKGIPFALHGPCIRAFYYYGTRALYESQKRIH